MVRDRCICCFSFWAIFCPFYCTNSPKNQNEKKKKKEKNTWRPHHFTHMYQKLSSDDVQFLRHDARQMDGQTDGWTDGKSTI